MKVPLLLSLLAHAAIVASGWISFVHPVRQAPATPRALPVELVTLASETKPSVGERTAKQKAGARKIVAKSAKAEKKPPIVKKKAPSRKRKQADKTPVQPKPKMAKPAKTVKAATIAPKPDNKEVPKVTKKRTKLKPLQHPKPQLAQETKKAKKKSEEAFEIASIENWLDESNTKTTAIDKPARVGMPAGTAPEMTVSELDALREQIWRCWHVPIGVANAENLKVTLRIRLRRNASLIGAPQILAAPQGQYGLIAAESAARAVRRCAPFRLPAEKFQAWQNIEITFDPKEML